MMASRILRNVPLGRFRLAELDDVSAIMTLVTDSMSLNFRISGPNDITYLIETSILSICQLDINETIVGFLSLKDFPLVPSINPAAWEDFVWTKYKAIDMKARNTIFVHMMCWNVSYGREVVDNLLKSVFMHDPYLQFIGMMKLLINHQLLVPGHSRAEASFKRLQVLERGIPGDQLPGLWVADRKDVSPRLRIRRAVEEDNDDIVPIIERQSTRLRELYGEFYVSELISRHPESERVLLVCEHKELAVGVMCLNTQINFEALEENFELSPFSGLRLIDTPPQHREHDSVTSLLTIAENVKQQRELNADNVLKDLQSRLTWSYEEEAFTKIRKDVYRTRTFSIPHTQLDILNLLEGDDDEIEFDIVNIDSDLLKLPRLFTNEEFLKNDYCNKDKDCRRESIYENRYIVKETFDEFDPVVNTNKKMSTVVITQPKAPEPTRYSGRPNAFVLEMFAMHQDYDDRYGFDMLEAAYELFPGKDYCIMCLPSNHMCFPLLEHFTLVTPFSCRVRFINETLYVAHVNSVRGDIRVRNSEIYDIPHLRDVLENTLRIHEVIELLENSLHSTLLSSFVLLSQNQPVGLAILGPLEDATSIRTQYNLESEPRRSGTDASILACVMSPLMEPHARWFLRDMLRRTKYTTMFWIYPLYAKGDASPDRNLMSLVSYMLPVRPRRFIADHNYIRKKVVKHTPFALWTIQRPLTSMLKVHVNNSIVVVGASTTALSFLETLLMGPTSEYLTFTSITLVSQHGFPTIADSMQAAEICVPRDGRYNDRYLKSIPFSYYVDILSAVMVKIDRKKKCIHLKGGGVKFYDELILICGMQFQHPDYLKNADEVVKEVKNSKYCDRILMDDPKYRPDSVPLPPDLPDNVMIVNSIYEANAYLRKLVTMISDAKSCCKGLGPANKIVVYGNYIEAYNCMAALLELDIEPENIAFVEPFPAEDISQMRVNCFNNEIIDARVQASIEKLGIKTYRRCHFHGWSVKDSRVEFIRLMSPLHAINLACFALFYYGIKAIDLNAFKAINECGLVYDGGLVVGTTFETNDPYIYGAGSCTKYSRRLYADAYLHKYYSSEDVGEALAIFLLQKLDPFVYEDTDDNTASSKTTPRQSSTSFISRNSPSSVLSTGRCPISTAKGWQPVVKFSSPLILAGTLPGPLYYMRVRPPGKEVPMAVQLMLPNQGHIFITDKAQNYFRLKINSLHCVESITCLSKKAFSCEMLIQLYGKHEAYLNNIIGRFNANLISDLYSYFAQPWMSALFQEHFDSMLTNIYEHGGNAVYDIVKKKYDAFYSKSETGKPIQKPVSSVFMTKDNGCEECGQNEGLRKDASKVWKALGGEKLVCANLTKFLTDNVITNRQYAIPGQYHL